MEKTKIMVVEDDKIVSLDICQQIEDFGYEVVSTAGCGRKAIDKIIDVVPDLVLMDIKLDGSMSGIETAHLIRLMYDVPIIFITGYSDISILRSAMLTEPYGYILKPYDSLALQISIELAIKKHEKEKKVIESEAQYRSIAESFDSYIYINDNQYNIRFLNKKLRNKIGRNAESKKCYKAIYNLEEKCSWCPMKQILKGKVVRKIRYDEKEKNTFKEIHTPFNFKNSQVLKQSILQNIKVHKSEPSIYTSYNNKEEMYGEIHNRVKNNLKLISGFLNIKSSNLTDLNAKQAIQESLNRINSMMLLHDKLNVKNFRYIRFEEYLKNLSSYLVELYSVNREKVNFTINAQNIILDAETAIPAGLITSELVSNALKHAFKNHTDNGKINIILKQKGDGRYFLNVNDNGIGIPQHINLNKCTTTGMKIVSMLTEMLSGEMKVHVDNGTGIFIKFNEFGYKER